MFTGIIENIGIINKIQKYDNSIKLFVSSSFSLSDIKVGDSITVNGVCLTVSDISDDDKISIMKKFIKSANALVYINRVFLCPRYTAKKIKWRRVRIIG